MDSTAFNNHGFFERSKCRSAAESLSRRGFLKAIGAGSAMLALGGCRGIFECCFGKSKRPNIIFILADDLGYGDLGCYGQELISTPCIDRMAKEGMRFTQFYSGHTVCAPSRCSLLTGFHTGHCQVRGNKHIYPGQYPLAAEAVTVAEVLKQAGYATAAIGKWGLGGPRTAGQPNRQGFDHWFGYICQGAAHFYYPEFLWRNHEKVAIEQNKDGKQGTYSHDLIMSEAVDFIRSHKEGPFFLYLAGTIPHAELLVPEDSLKQYAGKFEEVPFEGPHYGAQAAPRAAYAAMVSRLDRDVGRLLGLLGELGIDKNTLVLFTSDNGPHEEGGNDPGYFKSSGPFRGIKRDFYEGGIRVPLIARWPGRIKAGSVSEHISAFWDFLPSFAELAGAKAPVGIDGISMVPTFSGRAEEQKQHKYLYWEFDQFATQAVRMGDWKAVRFLEKDILELYNLRDDIGESRDVAARHQDIVAQMKRVMEEAHTYSIEFAISQLGEKVRNK